MIGMVIAVIALAAMCAYFAVQSMHWAKAVRSMHVQAMYWEKIANAWEHAIKLDHVREWNRFNELRESEKTAVLKFGTYLLDSVSTEVWGEKDKEDNEYDWDTED